MREIKFRAYHKENKCFEYATFKDFWKNGWGCCEAFREPPMCEGDKRHHIKTQQHGLFTIDKCLEKKAKTAWFPTADWQQYTGLKDKNGKEIYEGDIVKCKLHSIIGEVRWSDCDYCYYVEGNDMGPDYQLGVFVMSGQNTIEIIGNIYENKELLK